MTFSQGCVAALGVTTTSLIEPLMVVPWIQLVLCLLVVTETARHGDFKEDHRTPKDQAGAPLLRGGSKTHCIRQVLNLFSLLCLISLLFYSFAVWECHPTAGDDVSRSAVSQHGSTAHPKHPPSSSVDVIEVVPYRLCCEPVTVLASRVLSKSGLPPFL